MENDMENKEIIKLLDTINASTDKVIDGKVLSCALYLVWGCGVKKKEIPELKIETIIDEAGKVAESMKIGLDSVPLPGEVQLMLTDYLGYLKPNGKYSKPDDKLFPGYNIKRTLERHVEKFYTEGQIFQKLRKAGIKNCYYSLLNSGEREEECLGTAEQFRITERESRGSWGTIQPSLNRKGAVNKKIIKLFKKLNKLSDTTADTTEISGLQDNFLYC